MYDLLDEPLIRVTLDGRAESGSLPELLAWLSAGRELTFRGLQPHQHHPWHAFLVQLGAIAINRGDGTALPDDPKRWRAQLLGLTGDRHEPWCLIVTDLSAPALLQPPVPEGSLKSFKTPLSTPDSADILSTARNHDIKAQRMIRAEPDHWLYALVTKQTCEGYSGKFNYGIARMNGGLSNRPCVAIAPSRSWSARFSRDVGVWLDQRENIVSAHSYDDKGHALLWLLPWKGEESLPRPSLDPFFIEVCRRIRLVQSGSKITGVASNSKVPRVDLRDHAGHTGDIWTPTQTKGEAVTSMTVPASGFNYKKLAGILFGDDTTPPPAQVLRAADGATPIVIAQALVRGQGKTEGYHERIVPIPKKARGFFRRSDDQTRLHVRSKLMILRVSEPQKLTRTAILVLFQGTREKKLDLRDRRADPWIERFESRVDDRFFETLFGSVDEDDGPARIAWDDVLDRLSRETFREATQEASIPSMQRFPILAAAEGRFYGGRKKIFAELLESRREQGALEEVPAEINETKLEHEPDVEE